MIKKPQDYSKRILLAVSGMSPQIVSETLYALTQQESPFIPTELRVITTTTGKQKIVKGLFEDGYFAKLCAEYALPHIDFTPDHIEVIQDETGLDLNDIKTVSQNEEAANSICQFVKKYTSYPDSAVHVSMAGGRKSMGFLMGYAISLFGRPQDRLSHVLVTEQFESLPDFYYPPKEKTLLTDRAGNQHDASQAEVVLADIPFVRLSSGLPANLISRAEADLSYSDVVRSIQSVVENAPHLTIDLDNKKVFVGHGTNRIEIKKLSDKEFGWLAWFAHNKKQDSDYLLTCMKGDTIDAEPFLSFLLRHGIYSSSLHGNYIKLAKSIEKAGISQDYISEINSRINKKLTERLGEQNSAPYRITKMEKSHGTFTLGLESGQITI